MSVPRILQVTDHAGRTLADLHETAVAFAEEEFARRGFIPFLWLFDCGSRIVWFETNWDSDHEKEASLWIVNMLLNELGVKAYAQMLEAYVIVRSAEELEAGTPSPKDCDDHDDVMLVMSRDRAGESIATRYFVTVRRQGLNLLGPRDDQSMTGGTWSGDMMDMFRRGPCPACGSKTSHESGCGLERLTDAFRQILLRQ